MEHQPDDQRGRLRVAARASAVVVVAIVALSMGLAIAAATVSIGMAQADALPLVGSESWFTIVTCVGVAVAAMSGLTAVAVRGGHIRSGAETPRGRRR